ncbi:MAG TPA: hypothetical protein EYP04_11915, partial [Anaerolineae bacterium]|nr:hypothetical protein [Anaerolineae bacterium]
MVRRDGGALILYLILTLVMTWPMAAHFSKAIPGDGFDGWQNYWNLWWIRQALLVEHQHPFYSDIIYHPTGVSLLFHTLNPLNGVVSLPIQLTFGLFPAYNSVVLFSFAIGGFGAYLLAHYALRTFPASGRLAAAILAGLVYTFSPFHFAHLLGHMQVLSLEWLPFYVLYLWRGLERAKTGVCFTGEMLKAGLFLILITLCDWYYALYALLFTAFSLGWIVWRWWRPAERQGRSSLPLRRSLLLTLGISAAFGLVLSPLLLPMIREASQYHFMVPDPSQSRTLSADLLAFLTPQEFHPLWGKWAQNVGQHFTSTVSEYTVFVGYVPLMLSVWALAKCRRRERYPWLGLWFTNLLTFAILALGPVLHIAGRTRLLPWGAELPLPYALLVRIVPFMKISRSVSRFDVMVMLSLSVLTAYGARHVLAAIRWARTRYLVGIALAGLILFEFLPVPYPISPPDTPTWYDDLASEPEDFALLNLPMNWDRPGYLLYQTTHGKWLTVAYISRDDPRTLVERAPVLQQLRHLGPDVIAQDLSRVGQSVLAALDVRYVVLDRFKMPAGEERLITEQLVEEIFGIAQPVYDDGRLLVYQVTPSEAPQPFLVLGYGWGKRTIAGGRPWRAIPPEASVEIWTARDTERQLIFTARSNVDTLLTLLNGDQTLGTYR